MKTIMMYEPKTIQYNIKNDSSNYLMNIAKMLKPTITTITDDESLIDVFKREQKNYDCMHLIVTKETYEKSAYSIKQNAPEHVYIHIFIVTQDEPYLISDITTNNITISKYYSFDHQATILALQTSDFHVEKENYHLGLAHVMLARKYAMNVTKGIIFDPAIHFKVGYCYQKMEKYNQAFIAYKRAIVATERVFNEYERIDINLTQRYMYHMFELGYEHNYDMKITVKKIVSLLEETYDETNEFAYVDLAMLYDTIIDYNKDDEDLMFKYFKKEYKLRRNHLQKDDWYNRVRFGVIAYALGDYNRYNISEYKAHHYYIEALMIFDVCLQEGKDVKGITLEVLHTLDSLYETNPNFTLHPIYIKLDQWRKES